LFRQDFKLRHYRFATLLVGERFLP
jgi:hypothetical protein